MAFPKGMFVWQFFLKFKTLVLRVFVFVYTGANIFLFVQKDPTGVEITHAH